MAEDHLPSPPAPTIEVCYRHPDVQTRVHCTRCERPICPDCMIPAPVGFQCPECVAEARREFRKGPGRPLRGGVSVTKALLVAIAIPFVIEIVVGGPQALFDPSGKTLFQLGAMQPIAVASGQFWRLFTAMFLHAGILHIALNAYFFYLFGRTVEGSFGRTWMLVIYLVSGFVASVASYAFGPVATLAVGASGAIAGVFGAFIAYAYRRRHMALHAANLRMALTVIVLNALIAFGYRAIDWRAHVGGLIAGFVIGYLADQPVARQRRSLAIGGVTVMVGIAVALVVWRTVDIRSMPGFDELVAQVFAFFG
ncbi:MAG TPA: rhomboid family intramembrane serine protease [Actinomycetota bacterium]|nr:rhomboid family intramembrane serine protease [Actinomycetota bacterium]